jgi:hypothetical protein
MALHAETDESDFKPFFDMIVGVLFILIILISAQMFFAQRSMEDSKDVDKATLERNRQIRSFLEDVADHLRMNGFEPGIDLVRRRLILGLDQVSAPSKGGIPTFSDQRVEAVGRTLSNRLGCIFIGPQHASDCMDWKLIKIGEVQVELRAGALPPESTLSPDRFTQLATTLFSAKLLSRRPDLLSLTGAAGTPLFRFQPLTPLDPGLGRPSGLVQFSFIFEP